MLTALKSVSWELAIYVWLILVDDRVHGSIICRPVNATFFGDPCTVNLEVAMLSSARPGIPVDMVSFQDYTYLVSDAG